MQDGPITGNIFRAPPFTGKSSDCVGASRIVTQPTDTYELRPVQPQYIAIPRSYMDTQPLVSNPEPQQFVSSPKSDCVGANSDDSVGAPHQIITQPLDTMPEAKEAPTPQVSSFKTPTVGQVVPKVGAINPLNIPGVPGATPQISSSLMQLLGQQLRHPMLGIPQAIQTISNSPGISDLVSAPGHLLTGLAHRLGLPVTQTLVSIFSYSPMFPN